MTTALRALQAESGASFGRVFDTELPARFADLHEEWKAARHGCALIDSGFRGLLRVTGSERAEFLQGMLSNEVVKLTAGTGAHAAYLTVQGRVVADMRVFVLADQIWLDVPVQRKATVKDTLERYIVADDVELADDDTIVPLLGLEGPRSGEVVVSLFGAGMAALQPLMHAESEIAPSKVRVAAVTHTGEKGFLIFAEPGAGELLWRRCRDAGAVPIGMEALDVLRVEAGIPWCDRDMDENVLAPEVGLETAISFNKGCYIGQEVVERVAARGQVQRKLMGLQCDGERLPVSGAKVSRAGEEVGAITSAVHSPAIQAVIALGYIRRSAWEPGTSVEIEGAGGAQVIHLPFYVAKTT